jgi:serine/threonine protein phosphatase PrpC
MGTTVTAIVALPGPGGRVAVANVGDSRTSLYRAGDFIRISKDHSRVQEMIDAGEISPDDEWGHPNGNVLTRAVGLEPHVEVDVYVITAEPRDRFLLCSDGLIDEVREEDIAEALWRHRDPQECADRLVDMANEAGGHDNITVIVVDVLAGDAA